MRNVTYRSEKVCDGMASESVRGEVFRFLGGGPPADVAVACVAESLELLAPAVCWRLVPLGRAGAGPDEEDVGRHGDGRKLHRIDCAGCRGCVGTLAPMIST